MVIPIHQLHTNGQTEWLTNGRHTCSIRAYVALALNVHLALIFVHTTHVWMLKYRMDVIKLETKTDY